ncbi:MAG TPA: hypothetical protein VFS42_07480 [Burkholderiaceae bacterium]|nr:hypothetical protein [Burkholderiaceae bacterium]
MATKIISRSTNALIKATIVATFGVILSATAHAAVTDNAGTKLVTIVALKDKSVQSTKQGLLSGLTYDAIRKKIDRNSEDLLKKLKDHYGSLGKGDLSRYLAVERKAVSDLARLNAALISMRERQKKWNFCMMTKNGNHNACSVERLLLLVEETKVKNRQKDLKDSGGDLRALLQKILAIAGNPGNNGSRPSSSRR